MSHNLKQVEVEQQEIQPIRVEQNRSWKEWGDKEHFVLVNILVALANIFVRFYESKLFDKISKPQIYYRYVDDTFALFQDEMDSETFLTNLNSLHTSLKFTSEKEVNQSLPFLDVLVTKSSNNFTTSVYRKATFTGEYIRWNSFGPKTRKINLIATLTHRAFKICSKPSLQQELNTIRSIFLKNGYPESVINARISKKILQFQKHPIEDAQRCPVYLKLPWIGKTSVIFQKKIKSNIQIVFNSSTASYFHHQTNSSCNSQRCSACFSTKHGRIPIRVPLRMPVRGQNFSTSAGQNPPTCIENYRQQNQ